MSVKLAIAALLGLALIPAALAAEGPSPEEMQKIWGEVAELEGKLKRPAGMDREALLAYQAATAEAKATVANKYPESPVGLMVAGAAGNTWSQLVDQGKPEYAEPARKLLEPFLAEPPEGSSTRDLTGIVTVLALIHGASDDMEALDRVLTRGKELGAEPTGYRAQALEKYTRARPGHPAPPLVGKTADGKDFSLEKWKGGPVLVHFWSTLEMEMLDRLAVVKKAHEHFGKRGLCLVGVNTDKDPEKVQSPPPKMHERVTVAEWAAAQGVTWPQVVHTHDPELGRYFRGKHNPHAKAWGVWETSALFLVGPEGEVLLRRPAEPEVLFEAVERLIQTE